MAEKRDRDTHDYTNFSRHHGQCSETDNENFVHLHYLHENLS